MMNRCLWGLCFAALIAAVGCAVAPTDGNIGGDPSGDGPVVTTGPPASSDTPAPDAPGAGTPVQSPPGPSDAGVARDTAPPIGPPLTTSVPLGKRFGDDNGVTNSGTSLSSLQSLFIVNTVTHEILIQLSGAALDNAKQEVESNDHMTLTLPGTTLPGTYALQDGALYSRTENIAQTVTDVEHFPRGVVGYFNVTTRNPNGGGPTGASSSSDLLWSGYDLAQLAMGHVDRVKSPLVLDLAGKGVTFRAPQTVFDIDGDGKKDRLAWVSSSDTPFLVRDRNQNGKVDGIDEMFGDGTLDKNGATRTAKNGFEALAAYDFTGDGVIDAQDPVFAELQLWFDENHDGVTDRGELAPLGARGIKHLSLGYVGIDDHAAFGNRLLQKSEAASASGRVAIYDVWFRLSE